MKNTYLKLVILSSCALSIVATGDTTAGGAGGGGSDNIGSYELFKSSAAKTSTLNGTAQQIGGSATSRKLLNVSGSLTHNTGSITVKDATYTLTDTNGANANKVISDGTSSLTYSPDFSGDYQFAAPYFQTYKDDTISYDVNGIIGIATKTSDIPTSNSAIYNGEAQAIIITPTSGFDLKSGKSEIVANFATAKVTATLNGFTSTDQTTGLPDFAPIDEIKITDMSISGNQFSSGTISTTLDGKAVNLIGTNSTSTAQGSFFGYNNTDKTPGEVGGHILSYGDAGIISGSYMAK